MNSKFENTNMTRIIEFNNISHDNKLMQIVKVIYVTKYYMYNFTLKMDHISCFSNMAVYFNKNGSDYNDNVIFIKKIT